MSRGLIPESFIQDLLARTDIVAVIEPRLALKRAGREFQALCPFHGEKTPSFTVSPAKQFYHCFGCGAHGNAIGFLMEYDRLEFVDAIEELAQLSGMEVPREAVAGPRPDQDLYALLAEAEQFYRKQLKQTPTAVDYLRQRGLSGELAARFRLGVAPAQWRELSDALGGSRERLRLLERAGLISRRNDGQPYDKFRDRIMFPIHDTRGRPVAFGGRVYGDGDSGPKYLNSPETELFHKSSTLYGLYQARQAGGHLARLVVVEGYMDVLALAQFGINEAVATLGTATTEEHARMLFRAAPEVVFCFDGDRAGRQAAARAMESVLASLQEGRQVRFLFLPEGEDPDSMVRRQGEAAFRDQLARATPFSEFFFARFRAEVDMSSLDGRSRLVSLCRPLIERIPPGAFREMMAERLGELAQTRATGTTRGERPLAAGHKSDGDKLSLVRSAIRALLHQPALAQTHVLAPEIRDLDKPGVDLLVALHDWSRQHPDAHTAQVIAGFADHPHAGALGRLAAAGLLDDEAALEAELAGALRGLEKHALRRRMQALKTEASHRGVAVLSELPALRARLEALDAES